MHRVVILGFLLLLPSCALSDRGLNLNAETREPVQVANAIDSTGLPKCVKNDVEDWSDISD